MLRIILLLLLSSATVLSAQVKLSEGETREGHPRHWDQFNMGVPRVDDHFMRQRILYRIDLNEKINYSTTRPENSTRSKIYDLTRIGKYSDKKGIVRALFDAYRSGRLRGYNPDKVSEEVMFDNFFKRFKKDSGLDEADAAASEGAGATEGGEGFDSGDPFGDSGGDLTGDPTLSDGSAPAGDGSTTATPGGDVLPGGAAAAAATTGEDQLYKKIEQTLQNFIEVIEERIFDKNKSDMYYDTQYIRLVFFDPANAAKENVMVAFRYDSVTQTLLDSTMWKNRNNDSEYRSIREIIELRKHNHIILDVSGDKMASLMEADDRRLRMVEFEHNLWEF
jgi:hypothetical protein